MNNMAQQSLTNLYSGEKEWVQFVWFEDCPPWIGFWCVGAGNFSTQKLFLLQNYLDSMLPAFSWTSLLEACSCFHIHHYETARVSCLLLWHRQKICHVDGYHHWPHKQKTSSFPKPYRCLDGDEKGFWNIVLPLKEGCSLPGKLVTQLRSQCVPKCCAQSRFAEAQFVSSILMHFPNCL